MVHYQEPLTVMSADIAELVTVGRLSRKEAEELFLAPTPPQDPQDMSGLKATHPADVHFALPVRHDVREQPALVMAMPTPPRRQPQRRSRGRHAAPSRFSRALSGRRQPTTR
jgi:hypothetical protein